MNNPRKHLEIDAKFLVALIAALVGILGFLYGTDQCRQPNRPVWLSPVLNAVCGGQPTLTATSTGLYDDYNNPLYDGKINTTLWEDFQAPNCDIQQRDGVALFSLNALSAESTICYLNMVQKVPFTKVGWVQAKLLGENNPQGDYSIEAIEFKTTGFQPGTLWLAQCGLIQTPKENKVELFFYLNNSYPTGEPETYVTMPASANQGYTMRLQLDEYGAGIWCFEDGKELAGFSPSRMDFLQSQIFSRHLVSYWSANSNGTYKADDVYVKP